MVQIKSNLHSLGILSDFKGSVLVITCNMPGADPGFLGEGRGSVVECLTLDRVRASPESLRCGPYARHIYPSLVLVQPRKTRPCLTERVLMGRKESNQTNKQNQDFWKGGLYV